MKLRRTIVVGLIGILLLSGCTAVEQESAAAEMEIALLETPGVTQAKLAYDAGASADGSVTGHVDLNTTGDAANKEGISTVYATLAQWAGNSPTMRKLRLDLVTKDKNGQVISPTLIGMAEHPLADDVAKLK